MELAATHFGLTIEPPAVPPGGTVTLRYRAVNHGAVPSSPASVDVLIDPAAAVDPPVRLTLGVLAPGESRTISVPVCLSPQIRNGERVRVQAALCVGDAAPLGSNVAVIEVRGRAVLANPPSGLVLRPTGAATAVLEVRIANTGDAVSGEERLTVDLPAGVRCASGEPRIEQRIAPLDPGERTALTVPLAIDGLAALPLQIRDAALTDAGGRRVALPASDPVLPEIDLPALALHVERIGHRVDVTATIANPNLAALADVVFEATWPRALRLAEGSLRVDGRAPLRAGARGAIATLKRAAGALAVTLARVPSRATVTIEFSAYAAPAATGELTAVLRHDGRDVRAAGPIRAAEGVDADLRLAAEPPATVAGTDAVAAAVLRGGDEPCAITFACDDPRVTIVVDGAPLPIASAVALGAGTRRDVLVVIPVDATCPDGSVIERVLRATSDRGDALALPLAVRVRARAWLDIVDWLVPAADATRIAIANVGSTPASGVSLVAADGTSCAFEPIAPGETVACLVDAAVAARFAEGASLRCDGTEPQTIPPLRRTTRAAATIAFDVPADVNEGVAFDARWILDCASGAQALAIRCIESAALAVVAGTTTIDDHAIADGAGARIAEGITLYAVPPRTRIAFATRCIARAPGTLALTIGTAIDGDDETLATATIRSAARAAFVQNPDRLSYYLDAPALERCAVEPSAVEPIAEPPVVDDPAPPGVAGMHDPQRRAQLARALDRCGDDPIADALGVLAALMPAGDPRDAFMENAERLSVKLRIPGYVAEADDYESVSARDALDAARLHAGAGPLVAPRGSVAALAVWCASIDALAFPALPVAPYVRAFVHYAGDGRTEERRALDAARDALRAALAIAA